MGKVRSAYDCASALERAAVEYVRARRNFTLSYRRMEDRILMDAAWDRLCAESLSLLEETRD